MKIIIYIHYEEKNERANVIIWIKIPHETYKNAFQTSAATASHNISELNLKCQSGQQ
jgi:hypothetical protein